MLLSLAYFRLSHVPPFLVKSQRRQVEFIFKFLGFIKECLLEENIENCIHFTVLHIDKMDSDVDGKHGPSILDYNLSIAI